MPLVSLGSTAFQYEAFAVRCPDPFDCVSALQGAADLALRLDRRAPFIGNLAWQLEQRLGTRRAKYYD